LSLSQPERALGCPSIFWKIQPERMAGGASETGKKIKPFCLMSYLPQIPLHPFGLSPSKPGLALCVQGFDRLSPNGWGGEGV